MINPERLNQILYFLEVIDEFKSIYRATYLANQGRHESDAEHTWHMAILTLLLHEELTIEVNITHTLELILMHDLVEIYAGDTYAHDPIGRLDQKAREELSAQRLFSLLPQDIAIRLNAWWQEFEVAKTPEAQFARAIDNLQAFAQNVFAQGKVWHEHGITEARSRAYNQSAMTFDPALLAMFEHLYQRAHSKHLWPEE
ncbi:MAG TPA: HD domain-containing protein [Ktedonosporobacter sp.]|jgi:putative hydrolase of HD superfamily|nr:HD domain-containing protein [Ktedonosporobacter sp.]